MSTQFDDIPPECLQCELFCESVRNCDPTVCLASNAFLIVLFGIQSVLLVTRLIQFFIHTPRAALKKTVFGFGAAASLSRLIKLLMTVSIGEYHTLAIFIVETALQWYGLGLLFMMYFVLLLFWGHLCNSNQTLKTWFTKEMKKIFWTCTVLVNLVMTGFVVGESVTGSGVFVILLCNVAISIILFGLTITALVQSARVAKLVKSLTGFDASKARKVNRMTAVASAGLLVSFIILILGTVLFTTFPDSHPVCQAVLITFRLLESLCIITICYPVRSIAHQDASKSESGAMQVSITLAPISTKESEAS